MDRSLPHERARHSPFGACRARPRARAVGDDSSSGLRPASWGDTRTAVLSVAGELGMETAGRLDDHMAELIGQGRHHLVLDPSALGFMDSSCLNVLIRSVHRAREVGGDLYLAAPNSVVRRILESTGLTTTLPPHDRVAEAEAEALAAAGGGILRHAYAPARVRGDRLDLLTAELAPGTELPLLLPGPV
ncbi:STAS domain-containing protein [Streptomyces sp. NPDC058579]|uniref:STAS domain-containing protein n=1 Tax=Streptomyces sp. NPDC058579 TaxID=3346548 RepID=UPI0036575E26